jgi:hypothetical protein
MDINEGYRFVQFLANQTQSGGIKPNDFNLASERAQIQLFYTERQKWQETQIITDALSPFLTKVSLIVSPFGRVNYPSDYAGTSSVRHTYFLNSSTAANPKSISVDVDEINDNAIGDVLSSQIVMPTKRYPRIAYYDNYMQVFPQNLGIIDLTYLREPAKPVWGFTIVNNNPVYDPSPSASTNWEFLDQYHNAIVMMICSYFGMNLREADVVQAAEMFKTQNL